MSITTPTDRDPLDGFTTAEILGEVARRVGGPDALRSAIAAADPAALTTQDRLALLDLFERASAAAGIE